MRPRLCSVARGSLMLSFLLFREGRRLPSISFSWLLSFLFPPAAFVLFFPGGLRFYFPGAFLFYFPRRLISIFSDPFLFPPVAFYPTRRLFIPPDCFRFYFPGCFLYYPPAAFVLFRPAAFTLFPPSFNFAARRFSIFRSFVLGALYSVFFVCE